MPDPEIDKLRKRVTVLEEQTRKNSEMLKEILDEIQSMEERGLSRFDAVTFNSPSEIHTAWRLLKDQAESSPDGYVQRENLKVKTASKEDIPKTRARIEIDKIIENGLAEEHPANDGRIRPVEDATEEDVAELFVSNFEQADQRRDKAESRDKHRDPPSSR